MLIGGDTTRAKLHYIVIHVIIGVPLLFTRNVIRVVIFDESKLNKLIVKSSKREVLPAPQL